MDYTFFANLREEFTLPEKGILSRVLHKDEKVNVTLKIRRPSGHGGSPPSRHHRY